MSLRRLALVWRRKTLEDTLKHCLRPRTKSRIELEVEQLPNNPCASSLIFRSLFMTSQAIDTLLQSLGCPHTLIVAAPSPALTPALSQRERE